MRLINGKENGEVENGLRSLMLRRLDSIIYGILRDSLTELHQPHAHTYENIKDLVDIFSSDLDAVYLEYFISL